MSPKFDLLFQLGETVSRPGTGALSRPATGKIWTVEGDDALEDAGDDIKSMSPSGESHRTRSDMMTSVVENTTGLTEEDTRILLEKEFDDYYEDRAHKSAGER